MADFKTNRKFLEEQHQLELEMMKRRRSTNSVNVSIGAGEVKLGKVKPATRASRIEKASDELMKREFGGEEMVIRLPDIMEPITHYCCVESIAFAGNLASSGLTIKCLVGCQFERRFDSINALRDDLKQHFIDKHADNMNWSGFCSKCLRNVRSSMNIKRNLTLVDEIEHIIDCHTSPKQKKLPAAR